MNRFTITSYGRLFLTATIASFLSLLHQADGSTYYCPDNGSPTVITDPSGSIVTRSEGSPYYDNNMQCAWVLDAGPALHKRVQIIITSHNIEWAPESAICQGYDFLETREGQNSNSDLIVSWCGRQNPRSITSRGRYMYIYFKTDDRNKYDYTGVTMNFEVFELSPTPGACPPGWLDIESGGDYCYVLKQHMETWRSSQKYCNYNQANLVSFESEEEKNFVTAMVSNVTNNASEDIWIGLNDIEQNGVYKWIDQVEVTDTPSPQRWRTKPHVPNEYLECIAMRASDTLWSEQFCSESAQTVTKFKFICKTKKSGPTPLYGAPESPTDNKGQKSLPPNIPWIIAGSILGVIFIVAVGVLVVYRHRKTSSSPKRQRCQTHEQRSLRQGARPPPTAPNTTEIDMETSPASPPSYEESQTMQRPSIS